MKIETGIIRFYLDCFDDYNTWYNSIADKKFRGKKFYKNA